MWAVVVVVVVVAACQRLPCFTLTASLRGQRRQPATTAFTAPAVAATTAITARPCVRLRLQRCVFVREGGVVRDWDIYLRNQSWGPKVSNAILLFHALVRF